MKLLSALAQNQMKAFFIWFPLSLGLSVSVWAEEDGPTAYFCVSEHSGGILYDKATRQWRSANFAVGNKYIVRRPNSSDVYEGNAKWVFGNMGDKPWILPCSEDFLSTNILYCLSVGNTFVFNRNNMRFQHIAPSSYTNDTDTPPIGNGWVAAGHCSAL